ncbi:MAG TPA: hypothetical protein VM143_10605 [Acidimicrobiales bacterium]|nr:hypothetical protein [Acidimicrobiales bacterium]
MAEPEEIVDLQDLVEQWGQEFAIERELAGLAGEDAGAGTWVTLADAERQAGVSRSTLRTWYRTGVIASRLMPGPHGLQRLVPLEVVVDKASRSPRTGPRAAPPPAEPPQEPEMPTATTTLSTPDAVVRLAELATAAATARAEAAEARAAAAEAALHAALERAAAAEAELRLRPSP